tara:strand:- start:292 stop:558 length:267 start_codon:yes stop_codon:yes gene_type:complete
MRKEQFQILMYALYRNKQLFIPQGQTIQEWIDNAFDNTEDELHENCRIFMEQEMNITDMSLDEIPLEKFNTPRLIEQREFYMNTFSNF